MIDWKHILRAGGVRGVAIWPLRLFLGVTFIWASVDKLVDPAFFNPAAPGYVGHQLGAGADSSPLGSLLSGLIVPNATLFGMLTMAGELLIGLAVLLGWYTRFSAILGLLINLMLYLTITWDVRPFYYGADIVFVVAWLTLALAGPGPLSVDAYLRRRFGAGAVAPIPARGAGPARPLAGQVSGRSTRAAAAPAPADLSRRQFNVLGLGALVALALGLIDMAAWPVLHGGSKNTSGGLPDAGSAASGSLTPAPPAPATGAPVAAADPATAAPIAVPADTATVAPIAQAAADTVTPAPIVQVPAETATTAPAGTATAAPIAPAPAAPAAQSTTAPVAPGAPPTAKPVPPTARPVPPTAKPVPPTARPVPPNTPTSPPAPSGTLLAAPGQVPVGQALPFSDPNSGGPAVLVHLASGYSAYSAVCTHRGCTVGYSSSRRVLACPCHGAVFDPAANAQPIAGPARAPLAPIAVTVGSDGGVYLAS